jgi:HK97 family phage major capsid protein
MSLEDQMREKRAARKAELDALLAGAESRSDSNLTADENLKFDSLVSEIRKDDERIVELVDLGKREAAADETRRIAGGPIDSVTVTDPELYARGNRSQSFAKDMIMQVRGDRDAAERLNRYAQARADEQRALGNTNTTGGSGGELAPPAWWEQDFIKLVRPGRVTADLFTKSEVPAGVSSINIPRMLTGTTTALQSTQNTALSQTDLTSGFVSTGFSTIGGKQIVSQQLLDQAAVNFDQIVMNDLAAAYAQNLGSQVILGAGTGANNNSVLNGLANASVIAANQAVLGTATAAAFYSKANGMLSSFVTNRYANPTCWLMHPRRWFWLLAQVDSSNRPLVVPTAVAYNPMASSDGVTVQGLTGTLLGLPVYIDPQIPTNLGAGTNQDEVFLLKQDDLWLFESTPRAEAFREPYADSMGVLFRLFNYAGTILNRYTSSIATMNGVGLVAPTF